MRSAADGMESAILSLLVIGSLILFIWAKITGKKVTEIIKGIIQNE